MKFCEKLVVMRKKNNMSQEQLADRLNVSRQAVSKWESGNSVPDMTKIMELCKILNCSLEELVDDGIAKKTSSNNEGKLDINSYFKEILNFITKTINMFWSMTFNEKIKCVLEMLFIILLLFFTWGMLGGIIRNIFQNILSLLPDEANNLIVGFCSVIYGLIGFILGIIVVIHIFKIRYLDYFITIEDENATTKSKEAAIENDDNKEKVQQLKFIDNKKNKIIIRDPKHSTYSFFGILAKILVLIIKLNLAICSIFAIITFVLLVFFQTMSIWFIRKSIFFLGTTLLLLGLLMINYLVLKFIYNFIFNLKFKFRRSFIIFVIGLAFSGIGIGISYCDYLTFDKLSYSKDRSQYKIKEFNVEMRDNIVINNHSNAEFEYIVDNNISDVKLEVIYNKNYNLTLKSYDDELEDKYYSYSINYYSNSYDQFDTINALVDNIKKSRRFDSEYGVIDKIKIYANEENIQKIKYNNEVS